MIEGLMNMVGLMYWAFVVGWPFYATWLGRPKERPH